MNVKSDSQAASPMLFLLIIAGHENTSLSSNDFLGNLSCKLQHLAWHPTTNLIAFASRNSLFLYHA
ncbi:hypothetical protein SLEP1_g44557 [Rubroshorea leprosula]|nr:hypothetical protein SLEP1_g44557 [Rubroshorea leprosula]